MVKLIQYKNNFENWVFKLKNVLFLKVVEVLEVFFFEIK